MRRFDVFADLTVNVDYRYRTRLKWGFTGLLYLFVDGLAVGCLQYVKNSENIFCLFQKYDYLCH